MKRSLDALRQEVEQALAFEQPALAVSVAGNQVVVAGDYFLNSEQQAPDPDGPIAKFAVRVAFDASFPDTEPSVRETGGVVPQGRHLNPDGSCCIGVWEQWLVGTPDKSVSAFFAGPFRDYFLSQTHYQIHGKWPFGELAHGYDGIVQAYAQVLGIEPDPRKVAVYLRLLVRPGWPRGHWPCPCGSGQIVRRCHKAELAALRGKISTSMATRMFNRLESA